jgi:hypothetical protein
LFTLNQKETEMFVDVFRNTSQQEAQRLELIHRTPIPNLEPKNAT